MSVWTLVWLVWLGAFAVIEGVAVLLRGTTLSQQVWRWFAVTDTAAATRWRRMVLAAFLAWLTAHFLTGGNEWKDAAMQDVLLTLAREALTALVPVIAALIAAALVQFLRKQHLEITAEQQAKFEAAIRRALQWAEEYFEAKKKAGLLPHDADTTKLKLNGAIDKVTVEYPKKTAAEIATGVTSKLAESPWGASSPFPTAGVTTIVSTPAVQ